MPSNPLPTKSRGRLWNISKRSRPWAEPLKKKRIIVGLNQFSIEEEPLKDILRIKPEVERYQKEKLAKVKKERDNGKVKETLAILKYAAQGKGNVVPPILEAVKAYATIGEISNTLRAVFGE